MEENKESAPQQPVKQEQKQGKPKGPGIFSRMKNRFGEYRRTLEISRKPDKSEYISSLRIITIGMAVLGFIGFIMFLLFQLIV